MAHDPAVAVKLGRRLRSARLNLGRSQRSIAIAAGVSQPVVSRLELGGGDGVPLATWAAVATAVGLELALLGPDPDTGTRWRRLIIDAAKSGGWSASSSGGETLLTRSEDRVVVHAWEIVTVVTSEIERLRASIEREQRRGGRVSGIVVVPATGDNRRRMSELRDELRDVFPSRANAWYAAIVNPHRAMPADPGVVWAFPDGRRLRPASILPGWIWTSVGDGPRFATGRRRRR
jgi:transcriptional regulator with XRE-family HTH domain